MGTASDVLPAMSDPLLKAAREGTGYKVTEDGPFLEQSNRLHATDRARLRSRLEAAVLPQLRLDPRSGQVRRLREDSDGVELWGCYLGLWTLTFEIHESRREVLLTGVSQKETMMRRR